MNPDAIPRYLELYRAMRTARRIDALEGELAQRGEASFHLTAAGHEGSAALAPHLAPGDWLHPHYRDKALILARGFPPARYLHSLMATAGSDAQGRRMPPFVADRALHLLSMPTLVGNNALQAAGVAAAVRDTPERPIVFCALGDGGSQEGEVLEAVAEAVRARLPVLFVIEDNHLALSTVTRGQTFYSRPDGEAESFYGLPIHRIDGSRVPEACETFGRLVAGMREDRGPRLVLLDVERLASHSNSDDERVYRSEEILERIQARDPIRDLADRLRAAGVDAATFERIEAEIEETLAAAVAEARAAPRPTPGSAKRPLPAALRAASAEPAEGEPALTLRDAMRRTLHRRLAEDPRASLCGQDIEDPKGDVFGVTRGLSTAFPGRVRNAPLTESTIVGAAIGRALAGERPIVFLQFADFFPVAYNQIFAELGSLYWRSAGAWEAPVVILAVTGGYRAGLGPFHAQSPEAVMAHVPGLDVLMPSTAADAAGLLNAAFASERPTVFLYPKNLLNERAVLAPESAVAKPVPIGRARVVRAGSDLTLLGWGNTVGLCERAAETLAGAEVSAEVLDLRSLSPWDREAVLASARRTGRLLVTHEDMRTCGLGGEVLATVAEELGPAVAVARVTLSDTYLPFNLENQLALLPSWRSLLDASARLLGLDLRWEEPEPVEPGVAVVKAMGSSPSDETVHLAELHAAEGDEVAEGDLLLSVEAEKASAEIHAPAAGRLEAWLAAQGDKVEVGTPVARIRTADPDWRPPGEGAAEATPVFGPWRRAARTASAPARERVPAPVVLGPVRSVLGSRVMDNEAFLPQFPAWNSDDVLQRTGIERRYWIGEDESALTLAVRACRELLEGERLRVADLDALICSTGTPLSMTPSLACRILRELSPARGDVLVQAHDVNAACSGYLYALQAAYDILHSRPEAKVLVVTAETLSPVLNREDPGTLFLFGDAATATLVRRAGPGDGPRVRLHRPVLSAKGEEPKVLFVPFPGRGCVEMEGQQVFRVAVRRMVEMLERACDEAGIRVDDLALVVPHQANNRIIESIRQRIKLPPERMFNHIRKYGNTSSNTIPLALQQALPDQAHGARVGLCAFGGGFTFGAAILDVL